MSEQTEQTAAEQSGIDNERARKILFPEEGDEYEIDDIPTQWLVHYDYNIDGAAFDQQRRLYETPIGRLVHTRYSNNDRSGARVETVVETGDEIRFSWRDGFDEDTANRHLERQGERPLKMAEVDMMRDEMQGIIDLEGKNALEEWADLHRWTGEGSVEIYVPEFFVPLAGEVTYPDVDSEAAGEALKRGILHTTARQEYPIRMSFELVEQDGSLLALDYVAHLQAEGLSAGEASDLMACMHGMTQSARGWATDRSQQAVSDSLWRAFEKLEALEGYPEESIKGEVARPFRSQVGD